MQSKDFAIGILSVTAVILLAALIIVHAVLPRTALAEGQNASSGDYLFCTGQLDEATELLYVVDTVVEKMNVYGFNPALGRIELVQQIDVRREQVRKRP